MRNTDQLDINGILTDHSNGKRKDRDSINLNPYNLEPNDIVSSIDGRKLEAYELDAIEVGLCNIPNTTQENWENNLIWVYAPTRYDRELAYVPLDVINEFQEVDSHIYHQGRRIIRKYEFSTYLEEISAKKTKISQTESDNNTNILENTNSNNNNNSNDNSNSNNNNNNENPLLNASSPSSFQTKTSVSDLDYQQANEGFNILCSKLLRIPRYQIRPKMLDSNNNIVEAKNSVVKNLHEMRRYCRTRKEGNLNFLESNDPNWQLFIGQNTSDQLKISDYDLLVNCHSVLYTLNFSLLKKFCESSIRLNSLLNKLKPDDLVALINLSTKQRRRGDKGSLKGVRILLDSIDNLAKLHELESLLSLASIELKQAISQRIRYLESSIFENLPQTLEMENITIAAHEIEQSSEFILAENNENRSENSLDDINNPAISNQSTQFNQAFPNVSIRFATIFQDTPIYYECYQGCIRLSWQGNLQEQIINTLYSNINASPTMQEILKVEYAPNQNYVDLKMEANVLNITDIEKFISDMLLNPLTQPTESVNSSNQFSNITRPTATTENNNNTLPINSEIPATEKTKRKKSSKSQIEKLWKKHPYHFNLDDYAHNNAGFHTLINQLLQSRSFKIRPLMFGQNQEIFEADAGKIKILNTMRIQCVQHERYKLTGLSLKDPNWKLFTGQLTENQSIISDYDLFVNFYRVISTLQINLLEKFTNSCNRLTTLLNSLNHYQITKLILISITDHKIRQNPIVAGLKLLLNSIDNLDLLKSVLIQFIGPEFARDEISFRILVLEQSLKGKNQVTQNYTQQFQEESESALEPYAVSDLGQPPSNNYQEEFTVNLPNNAFENENNVPSNELIQNEATQKDNDLSCLLYSGKVVVIQVSESRLLILPIQCESHELLTAVLNASTMLTFEIDPQFKNNELTCYVFKCNIQEFSVLFPNASIRKCFTNFENTPIYYEHHEDRIRISWFGDLQEKIVNTLNTNLTQGYSIQSLPNQNFVDLMILNTDSQIDDIEQFLSDMLVVKESNLSTSYNQSHLQSNTLWRNNSMALSNTTPPPKNFQP